jgi:riboflavin kinase / FMN adenylyltransferase
MKVATSLADADISHKSVVSIGNFDGVHLGHQAILKRVVMRARELGLQAVAMTFSPHPIRYLAPARSPRLISTLEQKIQLIEALGVDLLFIAEFDEAFSRLSPEEFINKYLVHGLTAQAVCVGGNFNFGYRQRGTIQTLREFRSQLEIIEVPAVAVRGIVASSSRIRELVASGQVSRACRLLGRWIQIDGRVVSGAGRGRTMKVPTLNLEPDNELVPGNGVYITRISLDGGEFMNAVTNIGVRPTFNETAVTIETFVLDDEVPVEAVRGCIDFLHRLRDEKKFISADELRHQIGLDVHSAQKFFRRLPLQDVRR